jgi:hypothetical protein
MEYMHVAIQSAPAELAGQGHESLAVVGFQGWWWLVVDV